MRESDIYPKIKKAFLKHDPNSWIYKIPDTAGLGGRRPFDMIILSQGVFMAIEVKLDNITEDKFQTYNLELVRKAGGFSFLINFKRDRSLGRNIEIFIEDIIKFRNLERKEAKLNAS